jgi:nitrate reductase NapE component
MSEKEKKQGKHRRPRWQWVIMGIGGILSLIGIAMIGYFAFAVWVLIQIGEDGFPLIIPQDCMGITYEIEGFVSDADGIPIADATIRAWNDGSFEKPPFDFQVNTDEDGYFLTSPANSFACTPFQVEVSAEGYETVTLQYYPVGEDFPDELPDVITVQLTATSE